MTSLELAKEHYFFEQQRKQELESALNLPITVLTVLTAAVVYIIQEAYFAPEILGLLLAASLVIAALGIVAGFAFTVKAFWRYYYSEVRLPEQLAHRESLVVYYTATGEPTLAEPEFERDLAARYAEAVAQNAQANQSRSLWLFRSKFSLSVSAIAVLLSALPFALLKSKEPINQKECCHVEQADSATLRIDSKHARTAGRTLGQPGPRSDTSATGPRPSVGVGSSGLP